MCDCHKNHENLDKSIIYFIIIYIIKYKKIVCNGQEHPEKNLQLLLVG